MGHRYGYWVHHIISTLAPLCLHPFRSFYLYDSNCIPLYIPIIFYLEWKIPSFCSNGNFGIAIHTWVTFHCQIQLLEGIPIYGPDNLQYITHRPEIWLFGEDLTLSHHDFQWWRSVVVTIYQINWLVLGKICRGRCFNQPQNVSYQSKVPSCGQLPKKSFRQN